MKKISIYLIGIFCILFLFAGCQDNNASDSISDQDNDNSRDVSYVLAEKIPVQAADEAFSYWETQMSDNTIYIGNSTYTKENPTIFQQIFCFSLSGELQKELKFTLELEEDTIPLSVFTQWYVDEKENAFIVYILQNDQPNMSYLLCKYDSNGTLIYKTILPTMADAYSIVDDMASDREGNLSLLVRSSDYNSYETLDLSVLQVDSNGTFTGSVGLEDNVPYHLATGMDGTVYLKHQNNRGDFMLSKINPDTRQLSAPCPLNLSGSRNLDIFAATEDAIFYPSQEGLWNLNLKTQESVHLFDWLDHNLLVEQVKNISIDENGNLRLLMVDNDKKALQIARLVPSDSPEAIEIMASQSDKKELVLVAVRATPYLNDLIQKFNESNNEYTVVLESYLGAYENDIEKYNNAVERIQINLLTNNSAFDLVDLDGLDVYELSKSGAFEDLTPYLESSDNVKREDIFEAVLNAYTLHDRLIAIPSSFGITCLIGRQSDLGDRTEWTLRELVDYANEYPDARLFPIELQFLAVSYTLYSGTDGFITTDGGSPVFDKELCTDYLKLISKNPDYSMKDPVPIMLQQKEALLNPRTIGDFEMLQLDRALFGEPVVYIGYPTPDRMNGNIISGSGFAYSIVSNSDCKEGAWAFLEFALLEGYDEFWNAGFPSLKELFEHEAQKTLDSQWLRDAEGNLVLDDEGNPRLNGRHTSDYGDWHYTYGPITEEDVAIVRDLISRGGHLYTNWARGLYQILSEESEPYFAGQKSLEEVVDIIEKKMMLYYSEMFE